MNKALKIALVLGVASAAMWVLAPPARQPQVFFPEPETAASRIDFACDREYLPDRKRAEACKIAATAVQARDATLAKAQRVLNGLR